MQKYSNSVQDTAGNAIEAASVYVYDQGTSNLSTIYSDNGITVTTNPQVTNSLGEFSFYAADGRYDIKMVKTGTVTQNLKDIILFDPAASTGSAGVGFIQSGTGPSTGWIARTVAAKLQDGVIDAADVGIVPDGTDYSTTMQALVDYISSTLNSGTIRLRATGTTTGTQYRMAWKAKSGVMVESATIQAQFLGAGTYKPGTVINSPTAGGNMVDQAAGVAVYGGGVRGIRFYGAGSAVAGRGQYLGAADNCWSFTTEWCEFENFADEGIYQGDHCQNMRNLHIMGENLVLNRTRASATYAFDFRGGDGTIIEDVEGGPSLSALTDANKYVRAIHIGSSSSNNFRVDNILGEFGDQSVVVEGTLHHIGRIRAEFAMAENFVGYCASSQFGLIRSTHSNYGGAGNVYDGIVWDSTSSNNEIAMEVDVPGGGPGSRYGINDLYAGGDSSKNIHMCLYAPAAGTQGIKSSSSAGSTFVQQDNPAMTLTANSATPNLQSAAAGGKLYKNFITANTNPTTITSFGGIVPGCTYQIRAADSNTTIQHNGGAPGFTLPGTGNLKLISGQIYTFFAVSLGVVLVSTRPSYCYGDLGDAAPTIQRGTYGDSAYLATNTTVARSPTLSTTGAISGDTFTFWIKSTVSLTGTYTFNGKVMTAGQGVKFTFDGSAWQESGFGSL